MDTKVSMNKKHKLSELLGLDDEGVEALLRQVTWLDDALKRKGISFKDLTEIQGEIENLSKDELKAIYELVGKLLKSESLGRGTDREPVKPVPVIIKLTYDPDQEQAEKSVEYVPAMELNCQEGIRVIERQRMEIKEKAKKTSPMYQTCAESIEAIEEVRGLNARRTKGRAGNLSYPAYELTENGIDRILAWRKEYNV